MPSKPGERKRRPLKWDDTLTDILNAVFEGRKSQEKIAEDCRVSARTLRDWMAHPDFQTKLKEMRERLLESCDALGVTYVRKEQRIIGLAQLAESAREQYEERPWLKEERQIGRDAESGEPLTMTNESFNRDAHAAFRASLADIAAELGERKNITELSGKDGKPIEISDARQRLAAKLAALAERRRAAGTAQQSD
jgi:hypothetical protein